MRDILQRLKIERRLATLLFVAAVACILLVQGLQHRDSDTIPKIEVPAPATGAVD